MSNLSVFIDESGNLDPASKYYLVTFVLHDQSLSIDVDVARLAGQLRDLGFPLDKAIHAGPIIRRENEYAFMDVLDRKRIFARFYAFVRKAGVSAKTFAYRKSEVGARSACEVGPLLEARLERDIRLFLRDNLAYFTGFDRVIAYYDNGQHVVSAAVRSAFEAELSRVEFRRVFPHEYRLLQAADMICTLELLRIKLGAGELTAGERVFFGSAGRLRKNYLNQLPRPNL